MIIPVTSEANCTCVGVCVWGGGRLFKNIDKQKKKKGGGIGRRGFFFNLETVPKCHICMQNYPSNSDKKN